VPVWGIGGCRCGASASRAKVLAVVWHQPASKTWPYLAAGGDQDIPKPRRGPRMDSSMGSAFRPPERPSEACRRPEPILPIE
jgi:hypothetical protein